MNTKKLKYPFVKLYHLLSSQLGVDLIVFLQFLRRFPFYLSDLYWFSRSFKGVLSIQPCLHDQYQESGTSYGEYFWQDLLVARWINEQNPVKHVDFGSRLDGFVAHVASFRELEVFDIRPTYSHVPGIQFRQVNMMSHESLSHLIADKNGYCDSISCLHVLEHLGLGRYGDPLDSRGYEVGLMHLAMLLEEHGYLYLSTPIGKERVEFNANWVFSPLTILSLAKNLGLELQRLAIYTHDSEIKEFPPNLHPSTYQNHLKSLESVDYSLAIMMFKRIK